GTIVETQRKNCKNQMVMVITNDLKYNIPTEWIKCTKDISSFKKVDQFEKTVKEFFKNELSEGVLILQCRYMPDSKYQLEQIIHILQLEHHIFYNEPTNNEKHKLIILLIHTNKRSPFPLIFRQKWNMFYVDYLLSTDTTSLQKDLKEPVTNVIDRQFKQNLSKCALRAFGKLHFPHSVDLLREKQHLSLLFEDKGFRGCVKILGERLKTLIFKAIGDHSIKDILCDLENSGKKRTEGSFFERHQNIIDTLLTLTFVNFCHIFIYLFCLFHHLQHIQHTNNNLKKYVESKTKRGEKKNETYQQLFERALQNEVLVRMKPVDIDTSHLLLAVINPQLYSIQNYLQCSFPFSYSIHSWCQRQLSTNFKAPNNDPSSHATMLEQIPIGNDKLTDWEVDYSLKVTHEYAMDLVRFEFSWRLHTPNQQIILRNVIVSMALLLCGKLTIATIEVAIHHYRHIIFHYSYLISICSKLAHAKEHVPENQSGQWLAKMTLSLWESIPLKEMYTTSRDILSFPISISILFNFLLKHLQNDNTNLVNKLLINARKIEIQRLGVIYLGTSEFINEEKHLIEHGFLENETSIDHILQGYSTHRNASKEKYSDFIQDLLSTIKRVERIEDNTDKHKVYISILQKLNSKIGNKLIPKLHILKEMVSYGYLNNNLALYSDEATWLNRCLELILWKKKINEDSEDWKKLFDKDNTSYVVKISKVKVDVAKLIFAMINENIDLPQLEQNQSISNSLEEMSKLLLDFSSCYGQYEHALHVWFLKQLYMWKGIHWIEIIFTPSDAEMKYPLFEKLKMSSVFKCLRPRTLYNNSFNPFIELYENGIHMNNIKPIINNEFIVVPTNQSLNIPTSPLMIAESLSLINFYDRYTNRQMQNLLAYIQSDPLKQIFTHWITSKNDQFSARDTIDVIVTRLGFHF
ncbi:hypothetical protein RFI_28579, partial [Reticulomyxa filosa]